MNIRPFIHASLILASVPLTACSGDDDSGSNNTGGTGGGGAVSPLAGHTYVLTTDNRSWTKPKGIAKDVENVMPHFLFKATDAGGGNVKILMGVAPKVKDANMMVLPQINQDMCSPTHEYTSTGIAAQLGPDDLKLHLVNTVKLEDPNDDLSVTAMVKGLTFKNIFPPDGKAWSPAMVSEDEDYPGFLSATMDFRELAPLFNVLYHTDGSPPTPKEICDQLPTTAMCQDCGDGSVTCLYAEASLLHAEDHPEVTVTPVDINSRPATCK